METDYLVVGAGASGLAFTDTLVAETDAEVVVVDHRPAVGGHWQDAYPFVRLHSPSAYYGVNSLPLGDDQVDRDGENAGFYERASGDEVRGYFTTAAARLARTGQVRLLMGHEHLGAGSAGELVREVGTGRVHAVAVRRKVVDARYLEGSIPATHEAPFEVAASARSVAVNELPAVAGSGLRYSVLGSGKTAVDACVWLLENEVEPDRISWIRPRDAWFYDRRHWQPLDQVAAIMDGLSLDVEAASGATDLETLFGQLEDVGRLVRIDPSRPATMYRGTMLSARELGALRQIEDVIRLGRVRRIEDDRIVLDRGEAHTGRDVVHVDCTARGLRNAPATAIFRPGRIVLQQVRYLSPCFNAALIAFVEAHRDEDEDRNTLCPATPYPSSIQDWPALMSTTWKTSAQWLTEPDLTAWMATSRLNLLRALPDHMTDPSAQASVTRYLTHAGQATERMTSWDGARRRDERATQHDELRQRARATWAAGDWDSFSRLVAPVGARVLDRVGIARGMDLLDVGTGSGGTVAIPAAQRGARVVGSDLTPELFEHTRRRAAAAGVDVLWVEADAQALPFADASFDRVISTFGAMFAPDHTRAAAELVRVCRPGGRIAMTTWVNDGFAGELFKLTGSFLPPPPSNVQPPPLWGIAEHIAEVFGRAGASVTLEREAVDFDFPSVEHAVQRYARDFGPFVIARNILKPQHRWAEFLQEFRDLVLRFNQAGDGTARIRSDYYVITIER